MRIVLAVLVALAVVSCIATAVAGVAVRDPFVVVCSVGLLVALGSGLRLAT